jgi:hypothetical protein
MATSPSTGIIVDSNYGTGGISISSPYEGQELKVSGTSTPDNLNVSEPVLAEYSTNNLYTDQLNVSEPVLAEYITVTPYIDPPLILAPSLFTRLQDFVQPGEILSIHLSLDAFTDFSSAYDSYSYTAIFNRQFIDLIRPTDDILGEANIDDDQVAFVNKSLVDAALNTDVIIPVSTFNRDFLEELASSKDNEFFVKLDAVIENTSSPEDAPPTFYLAHSLVPDTVGPSDTFDRAGNFLRTFDHESVLDDIATLHLNLGVYHSTVSLDDITFAVGSRLQDYPTLLDNVVTATTFNREYLENITHQDSIALILNLPQIDQVVFNDTIKKLINPGKQETVLTNETRTANIQDYVEPYYVDLDYLGTDLTL